MTSKTQEENDAEMKAWGVYMGELTQNGHLAGGLPLQSGGAVLSASGVVAEPVNAPTEGIVGGYLVLNAGSFEQATELAKGCPHLTNEGNIEVRDHARNP